MSVYATEKRPPMTAAQRVKKPRSEPPLPTTAHVPYRGRSPNGVSKSPLIGSLSGVAGSMAGQRLPKLASFRLQSVFQLGTENMCPAWG